jgi:2-polyprenyl-3-methyl-5-hydroxy-6-metoxy-1,4-benzoquinol methylase
MTLVARPCAVCGGTSFRALYPASVAADADPDAFYSSSRTRAGHLAIVRCTRCDLLMTNPGDDDATLARVYAALEDRAYDAEGENRARVARSHLAFVQRHRAPPGALLDVGCATGTFVRIACDTGWQTTGLDASAWSLDRARERCPRAAFVRGLVEDAAFPAASFDAVTLWDTLEHVPDPAAVLGRVHAWLRPGGWLFVNVPNAASATARLLGRRWMLLLREHLWYFSPRTLAALLRRSGFACVATRPNTVVFSLANVAARLAQYESVAARAARSLAENPIARRVRLRFPTGEMNVAARKSEPSTPPR